MAKKKKGRAGQPEAAGGSEAAAKATGATASAAPAVEAQAACAVRAVEHLCRLKESGEDRAQEQALTEALYPLLLTRVAKYEEDTKAAKLAEAAKGNPVNASAGVPGMNTKKQKNPLLLQPQQGQKRGLVGGDTDAFAEEDIKEAVQALSALSKDTSILQTPSCKTLRVAMHPLVEAHLREEKASPAFRVTCALNHRGRWPEALKLLADMRKLEPEKRPKLGAYQRWAREVNAAHGDPEQLAMLDAIMRVAAGFPSSPSKSPLQGKLDKFPEFRAPVKQPSGGAKQDAKQEVKTEDVKEEVRDDPGDGSKVSQLSALISARREESKNAKEEGPFGKDSVTVIAHEPAHERKPPNRFDLDIVACKPGVLTLSAPALGCLKHDLPGVKGAFVLSDVLSSAECASVRNLTEAVGYVPDVPLSSPLDERAHNVVLMATEEQSKIVFERIKDLLPQEIEGDTLVGINRRWRIYRYLEGNAYRKHLDGAWPASAMRSGPAGREEYVFDADGGRTRSRFTFIIYLNDDFEGGATTFFVPDPDREGSLQERAVRPQVGSASVFPHGEVPEPVLHEGSPVTKGCKYLLRTDVLYCATKSAMVMRAEKRKRGLIRQLGIFGRGIGEDEMGGGGGQADPSGAKAKLAKKKKKVRTTKNGEKEEKTRERFSKRKGGKAAEGAKSAEGGAKGVIHKFGKRNKQPGHSKREGRR